MNKFQVKLFLLQDGLTCLHLSKFCDHKVDCPDNSDEGPQCKQVFREISFSKTSFVLLLISIFFYNHTLY